ncbi:DUF4352 domain-containing protein [Exiguobacterium sp. s183]|uniref:DUF4352 domain-containing protein n=1 Tax=Exiguobacterium sp. s183 TaxID=2751262 RepID=UPI001BE54CF3|nr:DUF4352 domain-containing protein [Exiguobacterium sp. s183]
MKVRHWLFTLPLVFLIGCGETDEATSSETTEQTEQATDEETTSSSEGSESSKGEDTSEGIGGSEEFEVEENELGISQIYMKNRNLGIEEKIGPIIFQIDKVQTLRLQVASDFRFMFDEKKEVTIVSFNVIVENTSDDTVSFHPNQARLVTNTGEQVDADLIISEDVGGEFLGKVKKEGGVLFHVDSMPAELTEVRFVVEGPYNEQFNKIAEERYEYTIDVSK